VPIVGVASLLDDLPDAVAQGPGRVWNVFARSLGEQGADGRTALAWRWALTGACPSPVALSLAPGRPPVRAELLTEAVADAELASIGTDAGGQVMHARFVLRWLAGDLDALPLWNGGSGSANMTDGASYARSREEIAELYDWALMARLRYPRPAESGSGSARWAFGWAFGVMQLVGWVCGEPYEGPVTGLQASTRPTLYQVSLDVRRAMTGLLHARQDGQPVAAGRLEAVMDAFLWLAGWDPLPPVDRHGHGTFEVCPARSTPCGCPRAGRCVGKGCAACALDPCARAAGQEGFPVRGAGLSSAASGRADRGSGRPVAAADQPVDHGGVGE
jgi:hypothetical protein